MEKILSKIKKKHLVKRFILLTIALLISAILFNLFLLPSKIVSGGTPGLSIILDYAFGFRPSLVVFWVSLILLLFSFFFLGVEKTSGSVLATFIYPIFIDLTAPIGSVIKFDMTDLVLVAVIVGVVGGIANGIIFKTGFTNGGLAIISQILYQYFRISISKSNFVLNGLVMLVGGIYFGWTNVMYAIIILYINSLMVDRVLLGISRNKTFYLITDKEDEIEEFLMKVIGRKFTIFQVTGGFKKKKKHVFMCVVPMRDYFKITEAIRIMDKDAFFVVTDSYEVSYQQKTTNS